ncbi:hypothetical protein PgNI_11176 [Pyricularia grisea]|uniref:DUF7703 domain-containing protein n=1 Tax=Pyricularia grisea TaxID=148305 RepID=A0A6P8AQ29_PYRGI|nr:hypothetical protein PgNI_11176 [Pyricularia grisea]TLD04135.1 hypothetical protein PgNI_11176 [Pyricularia grisea]
MDYNYVEHNGMTSVNPPIGIDAKVSMIFLSVALYNVFELLFIIYTTFKRRSGLYFWSFIVSTVCIIPYSVGFLLKFFANRHDLSMVFAAVVYFGWCGMVTGQSFVLWSRLHLVMYDRRRQRAVLIMIIVDAIICHGGVSVLIFGVNSQNPKQFVKPYAIFERIQLTIFSVQELIISSLYIYETAMLLRRAKDNPRQSGCDNNTSSSGTMSSGSGGEEEGRNLGRIGYATWRCVLTHLVYISILIILLDAPLLALQYADLYGIQTSYKGLLYSVKLKLEFTILNRLIEVTTEQNAAGPEFVNGLEAGTQGRGEGGSSSRNLRGMSSAKSPRQAYEETLAQLRAETPPPMPSSVAGNERLNLEQEKGPDRGSSGNMRINMTLGKVDSGRMVKFQDGQVGDGDEECRGFPLVPFEARAFRFDDDIEISPRTIQRNWDFVSGENSQGEQSEPSMTPTSFGHQRQMRSDEGAYLRNLDADAIYLHDMTKEWSRPATEPMGGPVFTRSRDLI